MHFMSPEIGKLASEFINRLVKEPSNYRTPDFSITLNTEIQTDMFSIIHSLSLYKTKKRT